MPQRHPELVLRKFEVRFPNPVRFTLRKAVADRLAKVAASRNKEVGQVVREIVECGQIFGEMVEREMCNEWLHDEPASPEPPPEVAKGTNIHRDRRMDPEKEDKIYNELQDGVTVQQLSTRWALGSSTIRRAIRNVKARRAEDEDLE